MAISSIIKNSLEHSNKYNSLLAGNFFSINSDMELIDTFYVSGKIQSVDISGIPQHYKHLQIRGSVKADDSASLPNNDLLVRFNGDFTPNYAWHNLRSNGAGIFTQYTTDDGEIRIRQIISTYQTDHEYVYTPVVMDILNYSSPTTSKTINMLSGHASNNPEITQTSASWRNTSAIDRIIITGSNLIDDSRISIYGVRA